MKLKKVHLVLKLVGEPDKFVSLSIDEKQYNIELKKIKVVIHLHNKGIVKYSRNIIYRLFYFIVFIKYFV